jgi:hypothetical protein
MKKKQEEQKVDMMKNEKENKSITILYVLF